MSSMARYYLKNNMKQIFQQLKETLSLIEDKLFRRHKPFQMDIGRRLDNYSERGINWDEIFTWQNNLRK